MKILIIGAGSIGCLFGAKLALNNHQIEVITNYKLTKIINESNLQFKDMQGNITKIPHLNALQSNTTFDSIYEKKKYDYCIISSKAYDLKTICLSYFKILSEIGSLFLLQNGIGNEEKVSEYYPKLNIYRMITSIGAFLTDKGIVEQRGYGDTYICQKELKTISKIHSILPEISNFIEILSDSGIKTQWNSNGNGIIWEKAMVNLCINPIGALTQFPNGKIIKIENIDEIFKLILKEAYQVAQNMDIELISIENMILRAKKILEMTSQNSNSMLQDIINKKPTEIEFLNGKIVELGKIFKFETPINLLLTRLIESIQIKQ